MPYLTDDFVRGLIPPTDRKIAIYWDADMPNCPGSGVGGTSQRNVLLRLPRKKPKRSLPTPRSPPSDKADHHRPATDHLAVAGRWHLPALRGAHAIYCFCFQRVWTVGGG
jgi:hypothetical protein